MCKYFITMSNFRGVWMGWGQGWEGTLFPCTVYIDVDLKFKRARGIVREMATKY